VNDEVSGVRRELSLIAFEALIRQLQGGQKKTVENLVKQ
jgi:hypothetical protein